MVTAQTALYKLKAGRKVLNRQIKQILEAGLPPHTKLLRTSAFLRKLEHLFPTGDKPGTQYISAVLHTS